MKIGRKVMNKNITLFTSVMNSYCRAEKLAEICDRKILKLSLCYDLPVELILKEIDKISDFKRQVVKEFFDIDKAMKCFKPHEFDMLKRYYFESCTAIKLSEEKEISMRTFFRLLNKLVNKFFRVYIKQNPNLLEVSNVSV